MQTKPLLRDQLIEQLRAFIQEQRSDTPIRISSERELAEKLGVSRISVRHALKTLVDEGLLVQRQGSGTYINPIQTTATPVDISVVRVLMAQDIKRNDPFFNECLSEITHYCTDNSLQLQVTREDSGKLPGSDESPLVILGLLDKNTIEEVRNTKGPIISTQYYPDFHNISQLLFDDNRIGWEAAEILHSYGHRRVIHLSGPDAYPSARARAAGFLDAAESKHMKASVFSGKMNWLSGYELGENVAALLRSPDPPTAVFASNDWMALGLMHSLAENRIKIPSQLSIIGCDDIHMSSEIAPSLSTFKWDMHLMVRELFGIIREEMCSETRSYKRVLLPARFIVRESLGSAS